MDIICEHCHTKLSIADNKIPMGKKASFLCPKCRQKVYIIPTDKNSESLNTKFDPDTNVLDMASESTSTGESVDYDAADKPFDFLDEDARTALICMQDGESKKMLENAFGKMKYHIISVNHVTTALTRMKYHLFDSIVLNDNFDLNNRGTATVLNYMQTLNMGVRRRIFAVLVSGKYHTADNMAAFHESVNLIINKKDLNNMEKIFLRNFREY